MNFKLFSNKVQSLINSQQDIITKKKNWENLKYELSNFKHHSRHINEIIKTLNSKFDSNILDYGCGSCTTILYLLGLGYENIWGIDIDMDNENLNEFLNQVCEIKDIRILNYNGNVLPFNDNKFDLIISQQVLEHVKYEDKLKMIREASRVMRNGGNAYYQIPHLFVPFEAHTKTWFIHWLPKKIGNIVYKKLNKNLNFIENHLFLWSPWKYKKLIIKEIGFIKDLSYDRITKFKNEFAELKGASLFFRLLLVKICMVPILGKFFSHVLSNFIMLEVLATKNDRS